MKVKLVSSLLACGSIFRVYHPLLKPNPNSSLNFKMSANKSNEELVDEFYEALNSAEVSPEELKKQLDAAGLAAPTPRAARCPSNIEHVDKKPLEENCPMCYQSMGNDDKELRWCKRKCGRTIHNECLDAWWASCATNDPPLPVTCPLCREEWTLDDFDCNC